ncbi:hypothetical protein SDJN03_09675, partial [Cucurbita argyrosperma subsp. sororia]
MAVPGLDDDGGYEDDNALFEEDGVIEFDSVTPTHLRDLANDVQLGEFNGLRTSLVTAGKRGKFGVLMTDCVKRMLESVGSGGDTAPTELADSGTEARTSLEAASAHMAVGY